MISTIQGLLSLFENGFGHKTPKSTGHRTETMLSILNTDSERHFHQAYQIQNQQNQKQLLVPLLPRKEKHLGDFVMAKYQRPEFGIKIRKGTEVH